MILIDILEEHLEEADFLIHQRNNAISDRVHEFKRLAEVQKGSKCRRGQPLTCDKNGEWGSNALRSRRVCDGATTPH